MPPVEYPKWLDDLRHRLEHESAGDHIVRIVAGVAGCSLETHPERLAALFLCNEPTAEQARIVSTWKTNCGTTMRAILCLAGCDHDLVVRPYEVGTAVSWVLQAARDCQAVLPARGLKNALPGSGLWYGTPTKSDDHVEWLLSEPDERGIADHGGGGRPKNAITLERGDIRWSRGRPLRAILDVGRMCTNPARWDNPY